MMHRDTMLKFGTLYEIAKYLDHTLKFQRTGHGRGRIAPYLIKCWDPLFILETNRARKLKFGTPYRHLKVLRLHVKCVR